MQKLLILASIITLLLGCAKIQVYETSAPELEQEKSTWEFENDIARVSYAFWASKGVMSFSIYNKTERPIYIDWKNSSFIHLDDKFNYWVDEELTSVNNYYKGYFYSGPLLAPGFTKTSAVQKTFEKTTRPERITFIPPKSFYYKSAFYLISHSYARINSRSAESKFMEGMKRTKRNIYLEQKFNEQSSPIRFRNYLALTLAEDSKDFIYVDNSFYVSSIKQMKKKAFRGKASNFFSDEEETTYEYPFNNGKSFYYEMPSLIAPEADN